MGEKEIEKLYPRSQMWAIELQLCLIVSQIRAILPQILAIRSQIWAINSQIWAINSQIWKFVSEMWGKMSHKWAIVKHYVKSHPQIHQAPRIRNYRSFCCVTRNPKLTAPCHICLSFRFDEKDNISEIRPRSMTLPGRKVFMARLKGGNIHTFYTADILSHH